MKSGDYLYIWQAPDWPNWRDGLATLAEPFAQVSRTQGLLLRRLAGVGQACALRDLPALKVLSLAEELSEIGLDEVARAYATLRDL